MCAACVQINCRNVHTVRIDGLRKHEVYSTIDKHNIFEKQYQARTNWQILYMQNYAFVTARYRVSFMVYSFRIVVILA